MSEQRKAQIRRKIGDSIRKLRKERNLTIEETAGALGVTHGFLGLVERGKRGITVERILDLCCIFGVSADTLLGLNSGEKEKRNHSDYKAAVSHLARMEPEYMRFALKTIKLTYALQKEIESAARKS